MKLTPTIIKLHQKSRFLEVGFSDGASFDLPCEYLRVFSPSAEVRATDEPVDGKAMVNITAVEPMGSYSVCLVFDDGHNTGIYSWETLYELGTHYEKNWDNYLSRLKRYGVSRGDEQGELLTKAKTVQLHYQGSLADISPISTETITLPLSVTHIANLLAWLRAKGKAWAVAFADDDVQIMMNQTLVDLDAPIESNADIVFMSLDDD